MVDVDTTIAQFKTRFAAAQGRVAELPESVRYAALRLVERVRTALDIPSRSELVELTARLEELDRRIVELASARVEELARAVPSLPAPTETATETVTVSETATETVSETVTASDAVPEPETVAADSAPESAKDARRRKIGRRASANKTSRR